jgi:F0F1-type ATP synthase assembly protein I
MEVSSSRSDILTAAKQILISQIICGAIYLLYVVIFSDLLGIKSALIGMAIAVIPSMMGMVTATFKEKLKKDSSISELIRVTRTVKLVYTVVMFILAFRFMALRNVIMLSAYGMAFLGCFLTPILNKPQFRMT